MLAVIFIAFGMGGLIGYYLGLRYERHDYRRAHEWEQMYIGAKKEVGRMKMHLKKKADRGGICDDHTPGVDVPRLMKETHGREFEAVTNPGYIVFFNGVEFRYIHESTGQHGGYMFGTKCLLGEWIEVSRPAAEEPESQLKTRGLSFEEAQNAVMSGKAKRMWRYSPARGHRIRFFREDFEVNNWEIAW